MKEYPDDLSGGQPCAAEGAPDFPAENHDLCAHGSPSFKESQEIKVSIVHMVEFPFNFFSLIYRNCLLEIIHLHYITTPLTQAVGI